MTDQNLEELRQRWEADPGSRVFLQLAEEYRRLGRADEAITVLEQGLERSPNHLSAKVALGRCLLEKEEFITAGKTFEEVLERDPTQLVANRLLVEAYLGQGEHAKAARRLDLYRLLNDGDPMIDDLQARLDASALSPAASGDGNEDEKLFEVPTEAPEIVHAASEEIFPDLAGDDPEQKEPEQEGPEQDPLSQAEAVETTPPSPPATPRAAPDEEDLFPELHGELKQNRYLDALHGEGLFVAATSASESPPKSPALDSDPEPLDLAQPFEEEVPPVDAEPEEVPEEEVAVEDVVLEDAAEGDTPEPSEGQVFDFLPPAEPPALAPDPFAGLEDPAPVGDAPAEEEASLVAPPAEADPEVEDLATVTLGNLYLEQGHRDQAREVFEKVLAREPENTAAREALAALDGLVVESEPGTVEEPETLEAEPPPLEDTSEAEAASEETPPATEEDSIAAEETAAGVTAEELLADIPESEGLTGRKIHLLRSYLRRIRREA